MRRSAVNAARDWTPHKDVRALTAKLLKWPDAVALKPPKPRCGRADILQPLPMEHAKQGGKHETGDGDFHDWFAVPRVCIWGHARLLRCCFLSLPRCRTRGKEIDTFRGSFAGWLTDEVAGRAILDTLCEVCNFLSPSGFTLGKGLCL